MGPNWLVSAGDGLPWWLTVYVAQGRPQTQAHRWLSDIDRAIAEGTVSAGRGPTTIAEPTLCFRRGWP